MGKSPRISQWPLRFRSLGWGWLGLPRPLGLGLAASVFLRLGRDDDAAEAARILVSPEHGSMMRSDIAYGHCVLGQLAAKGGDAEAAGGHFGRALEAAEASRLLCTPCCSSAPSGHPRPKDTKTWAPRTPRPGGVKSRATVVVRCCRRLPAQSGGPIPPCPLEKSFYLLIN